MTVLIDSGASFNFATKASVARNNALYASALEASKSNTNVSVRLATGSIVSTRKVTIPLSVKFDDFNSIEPFIVLDMDDRYDLDWRSRAIGASHNPLADRALAGHVPCSSRDEFVHEHCVPRADRQFAGSSEVLQLTTASPPRARELEVGDGKDPRILEPLQLEGRVLQLQPSCICPRDSVVAGSARTTEYAGACSRATMSGRAEAPTCRVNKGDKVTSTPKVKASSRDADSAAKDRVPQVFDVFTGETKVGEALTPSSTVAELLELEELSYPEVLDSLKAGKLAEVVLLRPEGGAMEFNSSLVMDSEVLEDERTSRRQTRYDAAILKDPSGPYHPFLKEFSDDPPSILPPDRGVRHAIELVPATKYCTTRQWPLPKEQGDVIDAFFAAKHIAGMVRESKSPHSSPTFCVRKPNGKWLMVHAFNKLNTATIPARASEGKTAVEAHLGHLREVLLCMRENHLYANINKRIIGAENIPFLGCFLGKDGVRADPEKVCAIAQWPVLVSQKDLRKWLGLANYLHKYSANYADTARPLTNLLKKDAVWSWTSEAQQSFEAIKSNLQSATILALPDEDRPFSVVCDVSDFDIGCALLQVAAEGRDRVVSFQSRQLKAAEKNYPIHDKELLAMEYSFVKFRVHLLGQKPFVNYTDHASLRTATSSPHLSQRMARWLSFFAEYNFTVESKRERRMSSRTHSLGGQILSWRIWPTSSHHFMSFFASRISVMTTLQV
ncbi:unnamed protein product [Phytophthora fragariaefolia]|uniref:Unnamed protein product n=1 Tax=Phytophthora fragariaefolia TaxID=1490495 RepID=A0A9W6TX78_9STRA|nr:unnamed protein product [Phytophthora fragariaefolia]